MKKLTITLTVILFVVSNITAQLGEIKGTVKDKTNGETMPGVTVYIETGGNMQGTATDIDGQFTIKPVKTGKHTVFFSSMGYKKKKVVDVIVSSDKITFVNTDLDIAVNTFDDFVVEAEMHDIPLIEPDEPGVQHIIPKEFKRSPLRFEPIKAIVSMTAGLTLAPNGKDVYVRGSRPQSTQFITDGIKSITGDIGIPGQAVGNIKVYTGGVPARYGDVTGGVIVVETKSYYDLAQEYMK